MGMRLNWKHLIAFAVAALVITQIAGYLGRSVATQVNPRASATTPPQGNREIRVVVSGQAADGVTQQHFDLTFLKNLEAYTVERVKANAQKILASQGHPSASLDVTSEATYLESGQRKLAIIRLQVPGGNQVFIAGIVGNELKRVVCVSESPEAVPISYGVCGARIDEVFGTKLGG